MDNILDLSEFNPEYLVFKDPRDNAKGGKNIPLRYNCPRRGEILMMFRTPRMDLPYGASQWPIPKDCTEANEKEVKYALKPSFTGKSQKKVDEFRKQIEAFQTAVHDCLQKDSHRLIGKKCSLEVIQDKCTPLIKNLDKPARPDCIDMKLRRDETEDKDVLDTISAVDTYKVGNQSKISLTTHNIPDIFERRSSVKSLVACFSLSLINGNIHIPLRPVQLQVYPGVKEITTNVFCDDSDDDGDPTPTPTHASTSNPTPAPAPAPVEPVSQLCDSDDEDDKHPQSEKTKPKPKPKTKAKKVKKDPPPPPPAHADSDSDDSSEHELVSSDDDDE